MTLIFITGASGAGKTTLVRHLKSALPKESFALHDIDESDLWTHDYTAWRKSKVDYWLQRSISNNAFTMDTILAGIIFPDDVFNAPSFSAELPIKFVLLRASAEAHSSRILGKHGTEEQRKTLDYEHVRRIEAFIRGHVESLPRLYAAYSDLPNTLTVETSELSAEKVCELVMDYILEERVG